MNTDPTQQLIAPQDSPSSITQGETVEQARWALEVCRACGGQGEYEVQHQVTRDMASDAGEPEMEGMAITERERCEECHGAGAIPDERVDALIAAVLAQQGQWQPIETAPKDGTWILATSGGVAYVVSWFYTGPQHGWWATADEADRAPTHWMPLPDPPLKEKNTNDSGAALLPVDPSASVKTEALPNSEDK
jgi:hypothetical protein